MNVRHREDTDSINAEYAGRNRAALMKAGVLAVHIMGSPGCGKTALLEVALRILSTKYRIGVIEGSPATARDIWRIRQAGVSVARAKSTGYCRLDAQSVSDLLPQFQLDELDFLMIENATSLACPIDFELGEDVKVTVVDITEGHDQLSKYPRPFRVANAILINKLDLLPYLDVNLTNLYSELLSINNQAVVFMVSAKRPDSLGRWCAWTSAELERKRRLHVTRA